MTKRIVVSMISVGLCVSMAQSAIISTDDVIPADPGTWTTSTSAYIGKIAWGSVTVNGGSDLLSSWGHLGDNASSTGAVTVTGAGSTWTNSNYLYVGRYGDGTLDIADGGDVSNT